MEKRTRSTGSTARAIALLLRAMPLASAGNTAMLFTAPDRPQRAAQLPEAKHGEPRLPLLRAARAESASSAGAAAQSSGSSSRNSAHLEEHVPPHDRVVFSEGYSPRVGLRVLLEGVEVARARLAEQLDLEALRLAEQRRQRSAGSRAKSGRSGAEEQSAGHALCCKSGSVRRSSCRAYWGPGGPTAGPSSRACTALLFACFFGRSLDLARLARRLTQAKTRASARP